MRWRYGLREHDFLEAEPDPNEVIEKLIQYIERADIHALLCTEWNKAYPNNPVSGGDDD
jgi:hypothetical protein